MRASLRLPLRSHIHDAVQGTVRHAQRPRNELNTAVQDTVRHAHSCSFASVRLIKHHRARCVRHAQRVMVRQMLELYHT